MHNYQHRTAKIDRILNRGVEILFPLILVGAALLVILTIYKFVILAWQGFTTGDPMLAITASLMVVFFVAITICGWEANRDT
jgi:hypothetical protein